MIRKDANALAEKDIAKFLEGFDNGQELSFGCSVSGLRGIELATVEGNRLAVLRKDSTCLLYTSPSPRDLSTSRMPSSA